MKFKPSEIAKLLRKVATSPSGSQYTIGRRPMDTSLHASPISKMKNKIREVAALNYIDVTSTTFCRYNATSDQPRVLVLGNCQAPNIARHVASASHVSVLGTEVMNYFKYRKVFDVLCEEADIILTAQLSEKFESISTAHLIEKYAGKKKIYTHTPVHFSGDHPDIVYWGGMGKRKSSPMGDYHSRIILRSFLNGLDKDQCLRAFNPDMFERLGYFSAADDSFAEWENRERTTDIKISTYAKSIWKDQQIMMTVNHPRGAILKRISDEFLRLEHIERTDYEAELTFSQFHNGPNWPVHELLLKHHDKSHKTAPLFWNKQNVMTLDEFVADCYALYRATGREQLLASTPQTYIDNVMSPAA